MRLIVKCSLFKFFIYEQNIPKTEGALRFPRLCRLWRETRQLSGRGESGVTMEGVGGAAAGHAASHAIHGGGAGAAVGTVMEQGGHAETPPDKTRRTSSTFLSPGRDDDSLSSPDHDLGGACLVPTADLHACLSILPAGSLDAICCCLQHS